MDSWVLYGATGYTGKLLVEEIVRRGLRPLLCGRNEQKLRAIAEPHGLEWKAVSLDDPAGLRGLLEGRGAVLHAAGPFVDTSAPMADACLATGCSYLDITGELPVFEALFARDAEAKARGIALIPGVGFDVVPSDCLLAWVASRLPGAQSLELAMAALGSPSAGTAKSIVGILDGGGRVRRNGVLVAQPLGKGVHRARLGKREVQVVPAPIADLVTAWHSTGIPNITVSVAIGAPIARALKLAWPLGLAGWPIFSAVVKQKGIRARIDAAIEKRFPGGSGASHPGRKSLLYAKASGPAGVAEGWLETSGGYEFTAHAAISAVEQVVAKKPTGALTPSQAFGVDFVLSVPGTRRLERPD